MRIGAKPLMLRATVLAGDALDKLSKAALIDAYCQALATLNGHGDDPVTLEEVHEDLRPLLRLRKDRMPKELQP